MIWTGNRTENIIKHVLQHYWRFEGGFGQFYGILSNLRHFWVIHGIFWATHGIFDYNQKDAPCKMLNKDGSMLGCPKPGSCSFTAFITAFLSDSRHFWAIHGIFWPEPKRCALKNAEHRWVNLGVSEAGKLLIYGILWSVFRVILSHPGIRGRALQSRYPGVTFHFEISIVAG